MNNNMHKRNCIPYNIVNSHYSHYQSIALLSYIMTAAAMERVLYNLHAQLCHAALQRTTIRQRNTAERCCLIVAVCCFSALCLTHLSFVYRVNNTRKGIASTCLSSIQNFTKDADVLYLSLTQDEPSRAWIMKPNQVMCNPNSNSCSETDNRGSKEIMFSYSPIKGYLYLTPQLLLQLNLTVQHVQIQTTDTRCFGEPFLQTLLDASYETVAINWLRGMSQSHGYVYNPRTERLVDLDTNNHNGGGRSHANNNNNNKLAVVFQTTVLYFIATTLVRNTLVATQQRMIDFTRALQAHVRSRRAVHGLVVQHLMENLVFVPQMIGVIFFLMEFYGDKFLAFLILSFVWLCEVFSVIRYGTIRECVREQLLVAWLLLVTRG
jgi:hypothetical protein